jgi:hypothetical protein
MSTIGFHHLIQRLGKAAKMPFSLHPHMLRHACGYKLANDGHDTEPCSTISATRTSSTPSDTPSFRPIGFPTFGEISADWRRSAAPWVGTGTFSASQASLNQRAADAPPALDSEKTSAAPLTPRVNLRFPSRPHPQILHLFSLPGLKICDVITF